MQGIFTNQAAWHHWIPLQQKYVPSIDINILNKLNIDGHQQFRTEDIPCSFPLLTIIAKTQQPYTVL